MELSARPDLRVPNRARQVVQSIYLPEPPNPRALAFDRGRAISAAYFFFASTPSPLGSRGESGDCATLAHFVRQGRARALTLFGAPV